MWFVECAPTVPLTHPGRGSITPFAKVVTLLLSNQVHLLCSC
jgi:hypothetical protein